MTEPRRAQRTASHFVEIETVCTYCGSVGVVDFDQTKKVAFIPLCGICKDELFVKAFRRGYDEGEELGREDALAHMEMRDDRLTPEEHQDALEKAVEAAVQGALEEGREEGYSEGLRDGRELGREEALEDT